MYSEHQPNQPSDDNTEEPAINEGGKQQTPTPNDSVQPGQDETQKAPNESKEVPPPGPVAPAPSPAAPTAKKPAKPARSPERKAYDDLLAEQIKFQARVVAARRKAERADRRGVFAAVAKEIHDALLKAPKANRRVALDGLLILMDERAQKIMEEYLSALEFEAQTLAEEAEEKAQKEVEEAEKKVDAVPAKG